MVFPAHALRMHATMKNLSYFVLFIALVAVACGSNVKNIFAGKTPHAKYEDKIEDSPLGKEWRAVSERALESPQFVQLPYSMQGYFPAGKPRALSFEFSAKKGEQVRFSITNADSDLFIYTDLFKRSGTETEHLAASPIDSLNFSYDIDETSSYVLRLQPRLENAGAYSIVISTGASLGFPVAGNKARTGSFWGASRDGGKRSHEGIDIFAPKLTPAIAAADGYITAVRDGGLGGKTVSLRPLDKNISLYYAHLDKQLVKEGQFVKKGDVVGLVGNTGNAKHTPSHLHFGIYSHEGAVDPFPFVDHAAKKIPAVPVKEIKAPLQLLNAHKIKTGETIAANTVLTALGVSAKGYLAELPDGNLIQLTFSQVKKNSEKTQRSVVSSSESQTKKS